jgi:Tol biopolymer transport system component
MNGTRKYTAFPVNARAALGVLLAGVLSVGAAVAAGPARATVGGANGQIAFALFNPAVDDNAVFTARPDGSDQREVFPGPAEGPRWSPTGRRIAMVCFEGNFEFVRNCTMNPDGSRFVQLRPDPTLNQGVGPWSPDGARLAFEGWDDAHPDVVPGVFTMRSRDGGDLERVTSNPYGGHDIPADYAPNGRRLVFIRDDPSQDNDPTALFTVNVNGTGLRQITPWALSANDPDGRRAGTGSCSPPKAPSSSSIPTGPGSSRSSSPHVAGSPSRPCGRPTRPGSSSPASSSTAVTPTAKRTCTP